MEETRTEVTVVLLRERIRVVIDKKLQSQMSTQEILELSNAIKILNEMEYSNSG